MWDEVHFLTPANKSCALAGSQDFSRRLHSSHDTEEIQRLHIFCIQDVFSFKALGALTCLVLNAEGKKMENTNASVNPCKWDLLTNLYHSGNPVASLN